MFKKLTLFFIFLGYYCSCFSQYNIEYLNVDEGPYLHHGPIFDFSQNQNGEIYFYDLVKGRVYGESKINVYKLNSDKIEYLTSIFAPFPYLSESNNFVFDQNSNLIFTARKGEIISDIFIYNISSQKAEYYSFYDIANKNLYPEIIFFKIDKKNTPLISGSKYKDGYIFPSYDYENNTVSKNPALIISNGGLKSISNYNLVEFDDGTNFKPKYFGTGLALSGNSNVWAYYKPSIGGGDKVYIVNHDLLSGNQIKYLINNLDFDFDDIFSSAIENNEYIKIKEKFSGNNQGIYFYYIKNGILSTKFYDKNNYGFLTNGIITLDKNNTIWSFDKRNNLLYNIALDGAILNKIELGEKFYDFNKIFSDLKNDFIYLYRSPDIYNPKALIRVSKNSIIQLSPNFNYTPTLPKENETITFKDESTGSPTSWQWDFGDANSSNVQNPSKKYTKAGTYKVKLTVNKAGATAQSITKDIVVSIVPALDILPKTFPNQPADGSKLVVNVKGNIDWEVSSNAAWLKVTPAGGSGDGSVNLTIEKSTDINDRTGKLIFKAKNISDIELIVNQNKIGTSTVLQVPSNLVAKTASATSIDLTWEHIGTATNTTFSIEQEQTDGTFKEIGKTTTNLLVYTISGLETNKTYCYRVKAIQGTVTSEASNKTCATLSNSKFRNGVTVVTHGFQPTGSAFGNGEVNDFVRGDANQIGLCAAIKKRVEQEGGKASIYRNDPSTSKWILDSGEGNLTDEIILFYNWSSLSNDFSDGALESAADNLFAMLARPKLGSKGNIPPKLLETDLPFHLIAHSRGNILFLQMLHRSLKYFPAKKFEHFTLLDPHPAMPMNDVNSSNELSSLPGVYGSPKNYPNEPNIRLPSNVIKADVIFRQANAYEPIIDEALFLKSENLFNLVLLATKNFAAVDWDKLNGYYGNFSGISVNNTKNKIQLTEDVIRNGTSNKLPHSGVHEWYRGTIVTDDQSFETGTRNNWYSVLPRTKYGYNIGRIGGGFENMTVVDNPIDLKTMDARTVTRTGSDLIPVFNSNFQYPAKNAMYGWAGLGGNISTDINIKSNELTFQKKSGNAEFSRLIPEIEHNYLYFNETDSFLGLQISKSHISAKINILFYNQSNESGKITLSIPESKTYFVKIPEELKGNVGKFKISLNGTANYKPVTFKKIYTSKTDVPDGEIITINWRNDEKSLIKEVIGITADGTARLSIAIGNTNTSPLLNTNRADKVTVSLSDKSGELNIPQYIGTVKPILNLQQKNDPNLIIHLNDIVSVSQQRIENAFLFDYQAPIDFNRNYEGQNDSEKNSRDIQIKVQLLDNSNSVIGEYFKTIQIVRPPLMLAHGLGGEGSKGKSTWRNFRYLDNKGKEVFFRDSDLFIAKRDINLYPTESFDKNSDVLLNKDSNMKEESFDAMISRMNDQGYACAKVDYVAHSMGGSVLRNTLEKPEFKNPKNYNQGYINKFITICTPHQGSPQGDIFTEFAPFFKSNQYSSLDRALLNESGFFDSKLNMAFPAIQNLALKKENGGIKFPSQVVPNHLIVGNFVNKFKSEKEMLETLSLEKETKGFDILSLTLAFGALQKFTQCDCKTEFQELANLIYNYARIDSKFSLDGFISYVIGSNFSFYASYPTKQFTAKFLDWANNRIYNGSPSFLNNSDIVVSVESQSAGRFKTWPKNTSSVRENPYTVFDGITHNFNPAKATSNIDVGNRVFDLLNQSISSEYFARELAASPIINSPISCFKECKVVNSTNDISNFKIFPNPNNGTFSLDISEYKLYDPYELQISDEFGTLIYQKNIDSSCCDNILVSFPKTGSYNVIVKTKNNSFSKKIIVTK